MIDALVKDIPNATSGFKLIFSNQRFPEYQQKLSWLREEDGGNWYEIEAPKMEGWLCPALFKYFVIAPSEIFVRAECCDNREK
jgi:hypothetical protein